MAKKQVRLQLLYSILGLEDSTAFDVTIDENLVTNSWLISAAQNRNQD